MSNRFDSITQQLLMAQEIVFFTGAGISVDSGIPTYRDSGDGLWNSTDPAEVSSIHSFRDNPEWVWQWYGQRKVAVDRAKPNYAHLAIAALEARFPDKRVSVVTQNIDGLHPRAGSCRVLELHGSINYIRCHTRCGYKETWTGHTVEKRSCPNCGGVLRPDIIWFGEELDRTTFSLAEDAALHADLFISIGTSALIQPAARLPLMAKGVGGMFVEVNPETSPMTEASHHSFKMGAATFFHNLMSRLGTA
ncbi:MAG: NAD-dependent deacylase [Zoogloea sp.]|nr:NAD-dependent deacylase [Zoogloea sp.]